MKYISFLIILLLPWTGANLLAQSPGYVLPADIDRPVFSLSFEKMKASSSSYYINYKLKNKGNGHLFSERNENNLTQNGGKSRPTSDLVILPPGKEKLIYNEFRVKSPMKSSAEKFDLKIQGLKYAAASRYYLEAGQLTLAEGATQQIGNFEIKARDYQVREERIFAEIKVTYKGDPQHVGSINLEGVKVVGAKAEIVKKGDILQSGKYYTFAINIYTTSPNPVIEWGDAFQERILKDIVIAPLTVKSVALTESETSTNAVVADNPAPVELAEGCSLSYTDFTTLKKDISNEANGGGNPVGLASEFMLNKKCLNTAQVIDLMEAFNMDGHRLDFAKMAYKYASDKNKYSQVVENLSYNKNKEALEEFLGNQ